jgi:hypothetical protein
MTNHTWNGGASFDKWRFERWDPVLQAGEIKKGAVKATNNGIAKLLSSEDILIAKSIINMEELDDKQTIVVEKIKRAMSEIPSNAGISSETVMNIIETFKEGDMHANTFGNTIKSN